MCCVYQSLYVYTKKDVLCVPVSMCLFMESRDKRDFGLETETETKVVSRFETIALKPQPQFLIPMHRVSVSVSKFETDLKRNGLAHH